MGAVGGGAIASTPAMMPGIRKRTQEREGARDLTIRRTEIPKRFTIQDTYGKVFGTIVKEQGVWVIRMENEEPQQFSYPDSVKKYVASL